MAMETSRVFGRYTRVLYQRGFGGGKYYLCDSHPGAYFVPHRRFITTSSTLTRQFRFLSSASNATPNYFSFQSRQKAVKASSKGQVDMPTEEDTVSGDNPSMALLLTRRAVMRLKQLKRLMRLQVESGGCSGFQYHFHLMESYELTENDSVSYFEDCGVVIDDVSLQLMSECIIDYVDELICASFVVKQNKIATASCGCGHSFDVKF